MDRKGTSNHMDQKVKQYQVLFSKVKNDHARLRTDTMEGIATDLPEIDKQFVVYGKPLESGSFRRVNTSPVKQIDNIDGVYFLTTESGSVYSVKVLAEIEADNGNMEH